MLSTFAKRRDGHHSDDPLAMPIPAYIGNQFALRYHVALESMKVGKGNATAAQALLEMVLAAGLLVDCGHGRLNRQQTRKAEQAIAIATREGLRFKTWKLSADGFDALCTMITEHDFQLGSANAGDVIRVLERVNELSQWQVRRYRNPDSVGAVSPFA